MSSLGKTIKAVNAAAALRASAAADNGAGTIKPTPYQTITYVSVNSIDPEKFKSKDKETFMKYFDSAFFSNSSSEETYNAIAGMSSSATTVALREKVSNYIYIYIYIYI